MANYTQITDFSAKDALPTGNANKAVIGADFDTEFAAIAAAIATKANSGDVQTDVIMATGDLVVGDASGDAARLAVGTDGQFLEADSSEASGLKWSGGPSMALVVAETAFTTSAGEEDITLPTSGYTYFELVISGLYAASGTPGLNFQCGNTSPVTTAGAYDFQTHRVISAYTVNNGGGSETAIELAGGTNIGNSTSELYSGRVQIFNSASASAVTQIIYQAYHLQGGNHTTSGGGGQRISATTDDVIRISLTSGNFGGGTYAVYGYRNA